MTFRALATASAAIAIVACAAGTRPAPAEPRSVVAPCWTPLGRHIVVAEPGAERARPPRPAGPTDMARDPAELTLPALFVATAIVVQARVAHVGSMYRYGEGTELIDVDLDVDEVVKNLSALPLARHAPLRVTVMAGNRGGPHDFIQPVLTPGRRSVWLLNPWIGPRGTGRLSSVIQAIDVDRNGRLTAVPGLGDFAVTREIAKARDLTGLCARMRSLAGAPVENADDLERALLRRANITIPQQQRVYEAQMRRDAEAITTYLFVAFTNVGRGQDRRFPTTLCPTDNVRAQFDGKGPPCMSDTAMEWRANHAPL